MKTHLSRMNSVFSNLPLKWLGWAGLGLLALMAFISSSVWLPAFSSLADRLGDAPHGMVEEPSAVDDHADHGHAGHDESQSIELTLQARKNMGLKVGEVQATNFSRSLTVPALVAERPGRTHQKVAAPLTGVVTAVQVVGNETVKSGDLLFNLRLTHEDLVKSQTDFLTTLGQLDVERRELARLEKINSGVLAQKVVLERQYEVDKLQAVLKAQRGSLRLHGLTEEQIDAIVQERTLIRELKVAAPFFHPDSSIHSESEVERRPNPGAYGSIAAVDDNHELESQRFVVTQLAVQIGEAVEAGQTLCVLTDYSELFIEGQAFEQDAEEIIRAANAGLRVTAIPEQPGLMSPSGLEELEIVHVANEVDRDSRALHFYVNLPNEIVRESQRSGHTFVTWRFKAGQRMQVRVPVEQWENVIVLPVDAVAQEGLETFVFVENGDHFDRRSVHLQYRDQYGAVIANDGSIFPGDMVALSGAHQLQMALKNKAGGGVDPHAGHTH